MPELRFDGPPLPRKWFVVAVDSAGWPVAILAGPFVNDVDQAPARHRFPGARIMNEIQLVPAPDLWDNHTQEVRR